MSNSIKKYGLFQLVIVLFGGIFLGFVGLIMFIIDDFKIDYLRPDGAITFGSSVAGFLVYIGCSFVVGGFLFAILLTFLKYLFPEIMLFKTKEESQQHKEKIYSSIKLSWIKKLFPNYYENLVVNYYETPNDIIKDIIKYVRYFFLAVALCLPFYYLAFNSYFYSTKDYFYYNKFFSFQEDKFNLDEVKKIEIKFTLSDGKNPSINFKYHIIFNDDKKFDLSEAGIVDVAKLDKILKSKGVKKDYLNIEKEAFIFVRNNKDDEYIKSMESIFLDYNN